MINRIHLAPGRLTVVVFAFLLSVFALALVQAAPTHAAPKTWDGDTCYSGGTPTDDCKLSVAANWVGDAAPVDGDSIILPGIVAPDPSTVNLYDDTGFEWADVTVQTGGDAASQYVFNVTGGGNILLASNATIQVAAGNGTTLQMGGTDVQGSDDLTIDGNDNLIFTGDVNTGTPSGALVVASGFTVQNNMTVRVWGNLNITAASGDIDILGTGTLWVNGAVTSFGSGTSAVSVGRLDLNSTTTINRAIDVTGNIDAAAGVTISAPATVGGNVNAAGAVTISAAASIGGNVNAGGVTTISSTPTITGNVVSTGNTTISGAATIGGSLQVTNGADLELASDLGATISSIDVEGDLLVSAPVTQTIGVLTVDGALSVTAAPGGSASAFTVTGATTLGSIDAVDQAKFTTGTLTLAANATIIAPIVVQGLFNAGQTLTFATGSENATIGSLIVDGGVGAGVDALVINTDITIGQIQITGTGQLVIDAPADISGNITVTDGTNNQLGGGFVVSSTHNIIITAGDLTVTTGGFTITGDVNVANGDLVINDAFTITGNVIVANPTGTTTIDETIIVSGELAVNGDVTIAAGADAIQVGTLDVEGDLVVAAGAAVGADLGVVEATTVSIATGNTGLVADSITVAGGAGVAVDALTINSPITVNGATTITGTGELVITAAATFAGTVTVTDGTTSNLGGGFTLPATNNLVITNGDATVTSGGFTVNGNMTLASGTITSMAAPFTVTGTLDVSDALTVNQPIVVGTLHAGDNLTMTGTLTGIDVDVYDVDGDLTVSVSLGTNPITSITVDGVAVLNGVLTTGALTVNNVGGAASDTALTVTAAINVTGNTVVTLGGATLSAGSPYITLGGNLTLTDGDLAISNQLTTGPSTVITVNGDVTTSGSARIGYTGTYACTTAAKKLVVTGDVTLTGTSGLCVTTGTDIDGDVTVSASTHFAQVAPSTISVGHLTVMNGGSVYLDGTFTAPMTLGSGDSPTQPSLFYNVTNAAWNSTLWGSVTGAATYNNLTLSGATVLNNNVRVYITGNASSGIVNFSGAITFNDFKISKNYASSGKLVINDKEIKNPAQTSEFAGDHYLDNEVIPENEVGIITGNRNAIEVFNGGTLKGNGTANGIYVYYGGLLSPGLSPGTITVNTLLSLGDSSIYNVELQSPSSYDKVVIHSASSLASPVLINTNALLTVELFTDFNIGDGDKFTIIDNQPVGKAIVGTFKDLPEGAMLAVADGIFSISYVGGDGNDVVLTTVKAPSKPVTVPNTGAQVLRMINPGTLVILALIAAGAMVLITRRRTTQE